MRMIAAGMFGHEAEHAGSTRLDDAGRIEISALVEI